MSLRRAALTWALVLGVANSAAASPKVFVLDFTGDERRAAQIDVVEGEVARELAASGRFDVVSAEEVRGIVTLEQQRQAAGCSDDASCLAEIAGALGAEHMVLGSVRKLGAKWIVQLTLVDARAGRVDARGSSEAATLGELGVAGRAAARALLGLPALAAVPESSHGPLLVGVGATSAALGLAGALGFIPLAAYADAEARLAQADDDARKDVDALDDLSLARDDLAAAREGWHTWGLPLVATGTILVAAGAVCVVAGAVAWE